MRPKRQIPTSSALASRLVISPFGANALVLAAPLAAWRHLAWLA
jgi:hypothetical protein